jgi:N-acetylglutamate synthase-like GNAT family acetyltransferase
MSGDVALERATGEDFEDVVRLTTTARDFFVNKFGFEPAERSAYDERLAASPEWNLPRCSSAAFLRRPLFGKGCADR